MKETQSTVRQAWQMSKAGNLKRLSKVELPVKALGSEDVLVEVKAIGLNFADIFAMLGIYSATPKGAFVPGLEFSGIVQATTSSGTHALKKGDRVMGVCRFGAYTTHIVQNADYLVPIPEDWSFEEGAAFLVQALTAYYALFTLGNLKKGNKVLIHSAAGGVGILANRYAHAAGAYTVGSIGSENKRRVLEEERFDEILVRDTSFNDHLRQTAKSRPFDLVLECIGGEVFKESFKAMASQGRMVVYGSAHFAETGNNLNPLKLAIKFFSRPKIDTLKLISDNKSVMGFNLIWLYEKKEVLAQTLAEMSDYDIGKPKVGHTFGFDQTREAITAFQSGQTTGKVVVTIEG